MPLNNALIVPMLHPLITYSISLVHTFSQGIERVVFVGNYLCNNSLSTRMLAYAMDYWSDSTIKALFLRHEGYFGAVGSMVLKLEELASSKK